LQSNINLKIKQMSALLDIYLTKEKLEAMLKVVNARNEKGVAITLSIDDKVNGYGQNVSAYVSQTKEQREAKKERYYVGNGKVFWTSGSVKVAKEAEQEAQFTTGLTNGTQQTSTQQAAYNKPESVDDLPF
jgi:hypothetical protein